MPGGEGGAKATGDGTAAASGASSVSTSAAVKRAAEVAEAKAKRKKVTEEKDKRMAAMSAFYEPEALAERKAVSAQKAKNLADMSADMLKTNETFRRSLEARRKIKIKLHAPSEHVHVVLLMVSMDWTVEQFHAALKTKYKKDDSTIVTEVSYKEGRDTVEVDEPDELEDGLKYTIKFS